MDKLKKMISPGHSKDEEVMYGNPNVGTPAPEGSHLTEASHSSRTANHVPGTDSSYHTASAVPSHLSGPTSDAASTASIRSGVVGADQPTAGSQNPTGATGTIGSSSDYSQQGLTDRTLHQHTGPGHNFEHTTEKETPVPGYVHHIPGPHATDIANRLDPHVPGGYPASPAENTATESDRQLGSGLTTGTTGGAGFGATSGSSGLSGQQHHEPSLGRTAGFEEQRFDPSTRTSEQPRHDNLGRDAALAGGAAGVGAAGAYGASQHHNTHDTSSRAGPTSEDPASFTTGPHSSNLANIADPRVKPEPEKMKDRTTTGPHHSDTLNRADPKVDSNPSRSEKEHHHGRDTALAGGAGAAGAGAYEATRGTGNTGHDSTSQSGGFHIPTNFKLGTTQPETAATGTSHLHGARAPTEPSTTEKDHHHGRDAALAGGAGAVGAGAYGASRGTGTTGNDSTSHSGSSQPSNFTLGTTQPEGTSTGTSHLHGTRAPTEPSNTGKDHHYGRDAALVGGAGATGAGAYEATRGTGTSAHNATTHPSQPSHFKLGTTEPESTASGTSHLHGSRAPTEPTRTGNDHHYGRDAALAGGAGAAGAAAYGATRSDGPGASQATGAPQDARIFDQTQHVPDSQQTSAGWAADTKAQEKLQKERAKEAEKAHHKADKAHEHALKDEKAHEKAHEKALKDEREREKEAEKARRHSTDKGEKKKGGIFGFLHRDGKDTPEEKDLKQQGNLREADQAAHLRHQRELEAAAASGNVRTAGASFEPPLSEQQQHPDTSSPQRLSTDERGHNKLHKDPPAKVQRELEERAREQGTLGGASHSTTGTHGTAGTAGTADDGVVIEPRTGLPMNVGKYGTGQGGTDGSSNIHGYQGQQQY